MKIIWDVPLPDEEVDELCVSYEKSVEYTINDPISLITIQNLIPDWKRGKIWNLRVVLDKHDEILEMIALLQAIQIRSD